MAWGEPLSRRARASGRVPSQRGSHRMNAHLRRRTLYWRGLAHRVPLLPLVSDTIEVNGTRRPLLVAVPSGTPTAVVVSMHGTTSTPRRQGRLSRMASLAEQGAVVAFPQGSLPARAGWEWDLGEDVAFLDAVVDHLRQAYDANDARLCMTGMSGGARMASRFASSGRHQTRVLGAVAGLRSPAVERLEHPVRVLAFHGTSDRINPYAGGSTARWQESVLDAAACWARANGHSPEPQRAAITRSVTRLCYGPQDDPGAVTLWVCQGAGHTWPGSRLGLLLRLFLGKVSMEIDATTEIGDALATA